MIRTLVILALASLAVLLGLDASPAATAAQWLADPATASNAADAAANHAAGLGAGAWTGIIAMGITALAGLRYIAPLIPYVGPAWKMAADAVWNVIQHRDAKAADKAQATIAEAALDAKQAIRSIRTIMPDTWAKLPQEVRNPLEVLEQA